MLLLTHFVINMKRKNSDSIESREKHTFCTEKRVVKVRFFYFFCLNIKPEATGYPIASDSFGQ